MLADPRVVYMRKSTFKPARGKIDLTTVSRDMPNPLYSKGIYSFTNDTLTYCVAPPNQERPTEFATTKGDGFTLVVLKQVTSWRP